jgi:hypothetical protein
MADSISYNTAKLVQVVPNLKRAQKFLLDKFFPNIVEAETEEIAIDVDVGIRRLAPFVSPLVEGKLVEQRRFQTDRFKPAYIKDKRAPDLRKPVRRSIGERIGGDITPAEREMANLQFEMEDQIDMIDRRLEWMAASVLTTGTVVVAGEGYPTSLIDFGRDSRLTFALTGASAWGYAANFLADGRDPVPTANLVSWQALILRLSGAAATDLVFTNLSWAKFLMAEGVQGAIYYPRLGEGTNVVNPAATVQKGGVYMGRWAQFDLWLYNDWYVDDNGYEQPMLPDGYMLMSGPDMMGTRAFGIIVDPAFNYQPMAYAPKTWLNEDPAQRYLLMQSAPLVIPSRVNAALAVKVA